MSVRALSMRLVDHAYKCWEEGALDARRAKAEEEPYFGWEEQGQGDLKRLAM